MHVLTGTFFLSSERRRRFLVAGLAALLAGCQARHPQAPPVDPSQARVALREVLDAWKAGNTTDALKQRDPPIYATDLDWLTGARLVDYQVEEPAIPDDANLRCRVQLVLRDKEGREAKKQVTYVVGTSPAITVARELF